MADTFRERLVLAFEKSGKSRGKVADEIGVSPEAVVSWLSGGRVPRFLDGVRLCRVLDVDPAYLAFGHSKPGTKEGPPSPSDAGTDARLRAIEEELEARRPVIDAIANLVRAAEIRDTAHKRPKNRAGRP